VAPPNHSVIRGGRLLDIALHRAEPADILIAGDTIAEIGPPGLSAPADARVIDAHDRVLMPGLVNTHHHAHGALAKGMMGDAPSRWAPKTAETADHSLPYVVSLALMEGEIGLDAYDDARLRDPELGALMQRVKVDAADDMTADYPAKNRTRLTVRLKDGSTAQHELDHPKGHNQAPMSDAEISAKFRGLFAAYRDEARADAMIGLIGGLEDMDDVAAIFDTFA